MNQAANWNFPPNKSTLLYLPLQPNTDAAYTTLYIYIIYIYLYASIASRYSFIVGRFPPQESEHCFVCDRRTDYSGTIERITKHARRSQTSWDLKAGRIDAADRYTFTAAREIREGVRERDGYRRSTVYSRLRFSLINKSRSNGMGELLWE